jgi:hypothetical protein
MLVVLIILLSNLLDESGNKETRILVSAVTNTAVDRLSSFLLHTHERLGILLGLLQHNFKDFIRVGSLKRIAKPVLPYSLHKDKDRKGKDAEEKETAEAIKELQVRRSHKKEH